MTPSRFFLALRGQIAGLRPLLLAAFLVCHAGVLTLFAAPLAADEHWRDLHGEVRAGRIVALPVILDWLEAHYEGRVLEVELEREDGILVYEVEMIGPQGQIVEFEFDAVSGELIGIEGVNVNAMRRR
ncbi:MULTISPECIES: PepSY domain-containing protein [Halomonadaceae]|uniref:PepSY domain-containing protein n=1 Tax=Halomonadaceae TaxID=28256 RepID=UPI001599A51B|nr:MULTISPECIES: PepSY domain-containing protein [Halomonas]QJQ93845.1 PepSY domain-containing protein [Halomonas sp. PA5]